MVCVAQVREMGNAFSILTRRSEGKDYLGDPGLMER
jgi:hypothetical protein